MTKHPYTQEQRQRTIQALQALIVEIENRLAVPQVKQKEARP